MSTQSRDETTDMRHMPAVSRCPDARTDIRETTTLSPPRERIAWPDQCRREPNALQTEARRHVLRPPPPPHARPLPRLLCEAAVGRTPYLATCPLLSAGGGGLLYALLCVWYWVDAALGPTGEAPPSSTSAAYVAKSSQVESRQVKSGASQVKSVMTGLGRTELASVTSAVCLRRRSPL